MKEKVKRDREERERVKIDKTTIQKIKYKAVVRDNKINKIKCTFIYP